MVIILFSPWGCPFPVCLNNLIERTISSQKRAWSRGLICRLQNQHWLDASLGKWSLPVFSDGRGSELVPQWAHLMGNQLTNHSSAEGNCPLHVGLRRKEVKENGILWSALERMGLDLENSRIPGWFFGSCGVQGLMVWAVVVSYQITSLLHSWNFLLCPPILLFRMALFLDLST